MKKVLAVLLAPLILLVSFLLIRYPLFFLHGMKSWPLVLFAAALLLVLLALLLKSSLAALFVAVGYPVGFAVGCLFETRGQDAGGGAASDLWLIWTAIQLGFLLLGVLAALVQRKRKR